MVLLKEGEGDPQQDLQFWKWVLKVIRKYGAEGMSSDESDDNHNGLRYEKVYHVKIMVW